MNKLKIDFNFLGLAFFFALLVPCARVLAQGAESAPVPFAPVSSPPPAVPIQTAPAPVTAPPAPAGPSPEPGLVPDIATMPVPVVTPLQIQPGRLGETTGAPGSISPNVPYPYPSVGEPLDQPSFVAAPGKGIVATSADKRFQIGLRPRVQMRATYNKDQTNGSQLTPSINTLRLTIAGYALSPDLKYFIQFAFGPGDFDGNSSPVFDAYVEYNGFRDLNVRVGQYFVPFDRARTIREFALQFVDRQAVVRELSLDRDMGLMFSSQDLFGWKGRLAYNVFIGGGDGRDRLADLKNKYGPQTPGMLTVGRVVVRPWGQFDDDQEGDLARSATPHMAIGAAAAYNLSSDRDKSTFGNTFSTGTFNYTHAEADLVFKWRGFSLLTEVLYRKANKATNTGVVSGAPVTEHARSGYGYFGQVGQMLNSMLELTARAETLKGTDGASGKPLRDIARVSGRQIGGGFNCYLNGHAFKLQTDYFYAYGDHFRNGAHIARLQLDATF